jgi:hypothetical protein
MPKTVKFNCVKLVTALLYFTLSLTAKGQIADEARKFSVGVKIGGSVTWPAFGDPDQKETFSRKIGTGYLGGVQIIFPLKKNYQYVAEGAFAEKTRILTFNENTWENHSVYHFIDATMLLRKQYKFSFQKNVPSNWFWSIGPEVSYWLNSNGKIIINPPGFPYKGVFNQPADGNFNNMYYNDINRWLFSLVLGIGFKAPLLRNQKIATELRFISGHTYLGTRSSSHIEILGYDDTLLTNLKSVNLIFTYTFDFDLLESRKGKSTLDKGKRKR